ncbi:MAG: hypothetical protein M0R74_06670 [Dehalococcoidia bacterium]|nr:hypothetical protein [Dehalococcoidia bacterium]
MAADDHSPPPASADTREESGQGLAEYGLILAFIALVAIASLRALGTAIGDSNGFKLFDMF